MKLRNKKTGYIATADRVWVDDTNENIVIDVDGELHRYYTLDALKQEWEDYEEPEYFYYIDRDGRIVKGQRESLLRGLNGKIYDYGMAKSIGNVFDTEEEAEKALEKLKAWKRLKDNGFKFEGWHRDKWYCGDFTIEATGQLSCDDKDLDLLFGGEE